jgi:hypothetical protein
VELKTPREAAPDLREQLSFSQIREPLFDTRRSAADLNWRATAAVPEVAADASINAAMRDSFLEFAEWIPGSPLRPFMLLDCARPRNAQPQMHAIVTTCADRITVTTLP